MSGALGSALEYFDFALYGALSATLFPTLFFNNLGPTGGLLASFVTFGVGIAARPIGAIIFGHLGDRLGRKPILFATLLLMGGSSVLIGILPTGQGIGIAAVLVGLRFIQGLSLGGETSGNQIMTMEHSDKSRRGLLGSFNMIGSPISQVLANLVLVGLNSTLTTEQFASWGWRIPFLGSILIIVMAVFIRLKLEETPAFVTKQDAGVLAGKPQRSGLRVFATHPRQVALTTLAWGSSALCFFLIAVYGLSYLPATTGMSSQAALTILMIANGVSALFIIAGGFLSDRIGRKPVFFLGLVGSFVGIGLFFTVASSNVVITGLIVTLVLCSIQFLGGAQPALFAEQFPTEVRFSGSAMSYTLANLIFSAPGPFIATALSAVGGTKLVMLFAFLVTIASVVAVWKSKDGRRLDLATFTADEPAESKL
ncbi:MFS transporter [Sinomonas susongensis]|uniref:MFS transporter n=1 Tax=Sinomonas susongensis TaxID=1324851 RepID=UPI001485FFBD|nr:MFS transporter [Sinomonas susongensis]